MLTRIIFHSSALSLRGRGGRSSANLPGAAVMIIATLDSTTELGEVTKVTCGKVVQWTVVRDMCTTSITKELETDMKIWHHLLCARLCPTSHLMEVTRERALMLYAIAKGLSINVGLWISSNIRHMTNNVNLDLPHLTLITELIAAAGLSTFDQKML